MTVGVGKMKIQGVSTCQFLCMDCNGMLYGSRESVDECVFNEVIEHNHYNTYYSTKYSNDKRTFYLALNRKGQPKKVVLRAHQQLGHLSSFTRVLTRTVPTERAEGIHPLRHHAHNSCSVQATESTSINRDEQYSTNRSAKCPKKNRRRKKKKKKCEPPCNNHNNGNGMALSTSNAKRHNKNKVHKVNKKCENSKNSEKCQRVAGVHFNKKKQKKFGGDNNNNSRQQTVNGKKKKKNNPKFPKNKKPRVVTTEMPSTVVTLTTEAFQDEDYMVDNSTHWDWDSESSTANPEESISTSTTTIVTHPD